SAASCTKTPRCRTSSTARCANPTSGWRRGSCSPSSRWSTWAGRRRVPWPTTGPSSPATGCPASTLNTPSPSPARAYRSSRRARHRSRGVEHPSRKPPKGACPMADDPRARRFYVSWVDRRKDPWPKWAQCAPGQPNRKGKLTAPRPDDDPQWPGVLEVLSDSQPWLHLGPTLTAFFHPRSPFCNFAGLDRAYLLYEPELSERSPHEKLRKVVEKVALARGVRDYANVVRWVPIAGVTDHTDHKQVVQKLEDWVNSDDDPFNLRRKPGKNPPHI